MGYLVVQILVFLVLAAAIGFAAGWALRGARAPGAGSAERDRLAGELAAAQAALRRAQETPPRLPASGAGERGAAGVPDGVQSPRGGPAAGDDLKRIRGIGPALEKTLNGLGVTRLEQIAQWTPQQVAEIDARLRFRGRIQRDDGIGQARRLIALG